MIPYTIEEVSVSEMLPLKSISGFDPGYKFVLNRIINDGIILPIILSKNLRVLDGHKTLKAILRVSQEKNGTAPEKVSAFITDKVMSEDDAWAMYYIYNKKTGVNINHLDTEEKEPGQNLADTDVSIDETTQSANALRTLYDITSPIKNHLISALFADKLSEISINLHKEFLAVFDRSLSMGLNRHVE